MSARALAMHLPARNTTQSPDQLWDFSARSTLPCVGVQFIVTNDMGDPADLEHAYAEHGLLMEGADDGETHGAACTAMASTGYAVNGWCETTSAGSITILDPLSGEVIGRAYVSALGNGQFGLYWSQRVPVGCEFNIAALALLGNLNFGVRVGSTDVSDLWFPPAHLHVVGAYDNDVGVQNFGFLSTGFASRYPEIVQGSRSLTWNTGHPPIAKGYLSREYAYSDPAPGGGLDGLGAIASFTANGWTIGGFGFQGHVVAAVGRAGPVPLKGGTVYWENGAVVSGNPYSVTGATGKPLYALSTFGHIAEPDTIVTNGEVESFGVGFCDDEGVAYCGSLRMDCESREVSSRLVRRVCDIEKMTDARLALDMGCFIDGGMRYELAQAVDSACQLTQFVSLPVNPSD